jgi:hypothetical protein
LTTDLHEATACWTDKPPAPPVLVVGVELVAAGVDVAAGVELV